MTASSDTLRSPEPPSPAGPLGSSGRDPLVHTGRGLKSGSDGVCLVLASCPIPPCRVQASYIHLLRMHHQRTVQLVADLWFLCNGVQGKGSEEVGGGVCGS
ncbi:unnamed protein product [Pleuronectes platessa]|uniref:Uncharacterized protein n=1 Tax=Pleuronectes platessa TaxID=8262 RepID=A0A9N7Z5L4_PLEPL|nr:unnamed protein product [Pleuronectes platessa]